MAEAGNESNLFSPAYGISFGPTTETQQKRSLFGPRCVVFADTSSVPYEKIQRLCAGPAFFAPCLFESWASKKGEPNP